MRKTNPISGPPAGRGRASPPNKANWAGLIVRNEPNLDRSGGRDYPSFQYSNTSASGPRATVQNGANFERSKCAKRSQKAVVSRRYPVGGCKNKANLGMRENEVN